MGLLSLSRLLISGTALTAIAVPTAVLLTAPAASADGSTPVRIVESVGPNLDPTKTVTASCPPGGELLSPGGRVVDGGGDVILTSIVPDLTNHSVTVTAHLRAAAGPRVWTLTAYAVCNDTPNAPALVVSAPSSTMAAVTPQCPATMKVFGTGFDLDATGGPAFVNRVESNSDLTQVIAAGEKSPAATTSLVAYAVCYPVISPLEAIRQENTVPLATSGTFPQTVTVSTAQPNVQFYGVGGRVSGDEVSDIMIDALIPAPDTNEAHVQVNRFLPAGSPLRLNAAALAAVAVDPDEVSASTNQTGTFC
jgi:hypothetical protein